MCDRLFTGDFDLDFEFITTTLEDQDREDTQRVLQVFMDEGLIEDHRQPNFD